MTKTVDDASLLLSVISGGDERDMTSVDRPDDIASWFVKSSTLEKVKIAVPKECFGEWLAGDVRGVLDETIEKMREDGAIVEEISLPLLSKALSIYYILVPAEASSNLARFDGIKFWAALDTMDYDTIYQYYQHVRDVSIGDEPTRRIAVGAYVLRSGYYDAYYRKAWQARHQLRKDFSHIFDQYDLIFSPASPTAAWKIWEIAEDPLQLYLSDIYTVPLNLVWAPWMSLPLGYVDQGGEKLPVWWQFYANHWDEWTMFRVSRRVEELLSV